MAVDLSSPLAMAHELSLREDTEATSSALTSLAAATLIIRGHTITTALTEWVSIAATIGADIRITATITPTGIIRRFTDGHITRGQAQGFTGALERGAGAGRHGMDITEHIGIHIRCIRRRHSG